MTTRQRQDSEHDKCGRRREVRHGRFDPEALNRELYRRSSALTRSAHALEAAAGQLQEAYSRNYGNAASEVRSAALVAMHAALSAYELVGGYEVADWITAQSGDVANE